MSTVTTIGLDIAKSVFQVPDISATGEVDPHDPACSPPGRHPYCPPLPRPIVCREGSWLGLQSGDAPQ